MNVVLFVLTVISTFFVGFLWAINYALAGRNIETSPEIFSFSLFLDPGLIRLSLIYSLSLLTILTGHELGHYLTCRRYGIQASLPYFIPAPTLIGTLGAFIRIKSPFTRKTELLDVGANGPLISFILSVPALYVGLKLSRLVPALPRESSILFGEPLLLKAFVGLIFGKVMANQDLILHPLAVAGWVGLLVTSFNLFPVGQLDGGHILYAVLGDKTKKIALPIVILMIILGLFYWAGWLIWALLIYLMGLKHPAILDETSRLPWKKRLVGILIIIVFILSFIPAPVTGNSLLALFK
ncbi:MAG: site-2 protease family protein [Candidatus Saccharicenans sp.]